MSAVGVLGVGVVGGAVAAGLGRAGLEVRLYDRYRGLGRPEDLGDCPLVFLCVPTPPCADGKADLTEVLRAAGELARILAPGSVVAVKSTVTPGTCDSLGRAFPHLRFASVPEFLIAARPEESFVRADRVVIGAPSSEVAETVARVMRRAVPGAPLLFLRPVEAELVKLCSNAMLSAKVALANELAQVCAAFGAEWARVQAAVGLDRRIGPDHLTVTPAGGFGGFCLPKDLDAIVAASRAAGYEPRVLEEIASFNRRIRSLARAVGNGDGNGNGSGLRQSAALSTGEA